MHKLLTTYTVDNRYFYQGLEFIDGTDSLLMGEGWYGTSALAVMDLDEASHTIKRVANYPIKSSYFGEGCTYYPVDGKVY